MKNSFVLGADEYLSRKTGRQRFEISFMIHKVLGLFDRFNICMFKILFVISDKT